MSEILHEFEKLEQETKERIRDRTLKINGARMKLESILMQLSEEEAAGADLEEEILSAKNELSTKIDACKEVEAGMKVKTEKLDSMDRELRTLYSSQVAEVSQVETQILRASSKILRSCMPLPPMEKVKAELQALTEKVEKHDQLGPGLEPLY